MFGQGFWEAQIADNFTLVFFFIFLFLTYTRLILHSRVVGGFFACIDIEDIQVRVFFCCVDRRLTGVDATVKVCLRIKRISN